MYYWSRLKDRIRNNKLARQIRETTCSRDLSPVGIVETRAYARTCKWGRERGKRQVSFHDVRDRLYSRAVIRSDAWNVRNVNERRDRRYVTCHFHLRSDQAENFILCSDCSRPIRRDGVYWIDTRSLFFSALIKSTGRYYPLDGGGGLCAGCWHLLIV